MFGISVNPLLFFSFLPVGLLAAAIPGPSILLLVTQSAIFGFNRNLGLIIGLVIGSIIYATLAIIGVDTIVMNDVVMIWIIKMVGVTFLIYMGIKRLLPKKQLELNGFESALPAEHHKQFFLGVVTTLGNPKIAIFYFIVIPQFISMSKGNFATQYAMLAGTQMMIKVLVLLSYALLAVYAKVVLEKFLKGVAMNRLLAMIYFAAAGVVLWIN